MENLVGIGKDELDKKRPRLSTPPRHITENEIKAPIIPSSLTEDDSHFLLSRVLSKTGTSPKREAEVKIESEESLQEASKATGIKICTELLVLRLPLFVTCMKKHRFCMLKSRTQNYVCQCGKRFESSMSLSVHCSLVGHKFAEHFNTNQHRKTREPSDRKKILTQTLPVCISLFFFHFLTVTIARSIATLVPAHRNIQTSQNLRRM